MMRSVIQFTTAPAGTGKSYRRCAWYITMKWLPEAKGVHYSNFPVRFDDWEDEEGKARKGMVSYLKGKFTEEEVRERVKVLDDEIIQGWRNDGLMKDQQPRGPWEYFEEIDLSGAHIAIDEIHNFCGSNSHTRVKQRWQQWLGEIRHRGATVEGISQHEDKVAKEFKNEAELRLDLVACATRRDPYFKIELYYWYQLFAKARGEWKATVAEIESRRVKGRWKETTEDKFKFEEALFDVYDSFSAPIAGGGAGGTDKLPWERYNWTSLLLWFGRSNFERLVPRIAVAVLGCWVFFGGGGTFLLGKFMARTQALAGGINQTEEKEKKVGVTMLGKSDENLFPRSAYVTKEGNETLTDEEWRSRKKIVNEDMEELERLRREEKEREDKEREEAMARAAIVLISENEIVFEHGATYQVGETITGGIYDGRKVEEIEYGKRKVLLEGGIRVGIGGGGAGLLGGLLGDTTGEATYLESPKPGVSPAFYGAGGSSEETGKKRNGRAAGDVQRGKDAPIGVRTLSGQADKRVDSGGTKPRRGDGNVRGPG